jgi:hypothetical protein
MVGEVCSEVKWVSQKQEKARKRCAGRRGNRSRRDQVFCSTISHLSEVVTNSTPTSPDCAGKAIQVHEKQSRQ